MAAAAVAAAAAALPRDPNDLPSQGLKRKPGEPDGQVVDAQPERAWVKCIGDEAAPCCWDENGLILRLAPGGAIAAPLKFVAYGGAPGDAAYELLSTSELEERLHFTLAAGLTAATRRIQRELPFSALQPDDTPEELTLPPYLKADIDHLKTLVRSGAVANVFVAPDEFGGHGLYASEKLDAGAFVVEYAGLLTQDTVASARSSDNYAMRYLGAYPEAALCVSARDEGTLARFANHAPDAEASCSLRMLLVDGAFHLLLFTARRVSKREALTFDYGRSFWQARGYDSM